MTKYLKNKNIVFNVHLNVFLTRFLQWFQVSPNKDDFRPLSASYPAILTSPHKAKPCNYNPPPPP